MDPHPPSAVRRVSSARIGCRRDSRPVLKARPCSALLRTTPSWAVSNLVMLRMKRSWETDSNIAINTQIDIIISDELRERELLIEDEINEIQKIQTSFERNGCLLKRRPSTAPTRNIAPPCPEDSNMYYYRQRRLLNRHFFVVREETMMQESVSRKEHTLNFKRHLQYIASQATAYRQAWINKAMHDKKLLTSVGKISDFFQNAKRGRYGKRALRHMLYTQRIRIANAEALEAKTFLHKMRETLKREIELDRKEEILKDRDKIGNQESTARKLIHDDEDKKQQSLKRLYYCSTEAMYSDLNMYSLEVEAMGAYRKIISTECNRFTRMKSLYHLQTMLVLPAYARASKTIKQFWNNCTSGKCSVKARRSALRLELRRDREKRVVAKMKSITNYIDEVKSEYMKEADQTHTRVCSKKKQLEWERISNKRMTTLECYHETLSFPRIRLIKTEESVLTPGRRTAHAPVFADCGSSVSVDMCTFLSPEEIFFHEENNRTSISSDFYHSQSTWLQSLFMGYCLQEEAARMRESILQQHHSDVNPIFQQCDTSFIEHYCLSAFYELRVEEHLAIQSLFNIHCLDKFPICVTGIICEEEICRRNIIKESITDLVNKTQEWCGAVRYNANTRMKVVLSEGKVRKQLEDDETISYWHISNIEKTGERGVYTSTITSREPLIRFTVVEEENNNRRDIIFQLEEALFLLAWRQTRKMEANETTHRETILSQEHLQRGEFPSFTKSLKGFKFRSPWACTTRVLWNSITRK